MNGLLDRELCQGMLKTAEVQRESVRNIISMAILSHSLKKDVGNHGDKVCLQGHGGLAWDSCTDLRWNHSDHPFYVRRCKRTPIAAAPNNVPGITTAALTGDASIEAASTNAGGVSEREQ